MRSWKRAASSSRSCSEREGAKTIERFPEDSVRYLTEVSRPWKPIARRIVARSARTRSARVSDPDVAYLQGFATCATSTCHSKSRQGPATSSCCYTWHLRLQTVHRVSPFGEITTTPASLMNVTQILFRIEQGDPAAAEQLLPLVYDELRKLAAQRIGQEDPGQTLQATALVHEAYLRLVNVEQAQRWDSRGHFFAAAAESMRRILVENARRKGRLKRGGGLQQVELTDIPVVAPEIHEDLIALDTALDRLKAVDAEAVRLVHMRYFVGLSIPDAAKLMGIAPRTADRIWSFARAWLHQEIAGLEGDPTEK